MTTNRARRRRQRCWNAHRRTMRWLKARNQFTLVVRRFRPGTRQPHGALIAYGFEFRLDVSEWRDENVL